jgi:hypothetical protein
MKEDVRHWVAPHLLCGLGNRLFQVMAAAQMAERSKRPLVFFLPRMTRGEHGCWGLFLELFPTIPIVETCPEWFVLEEGMTTNVVYERLPPMPIVTRGFFQDLRFFPQSLRPRVLWSPSQRRTDRWAVHFRLGDYQILPHHQLPLGPYYRQTLESRCPRHTPLTLFSDSPEALPKIQKELQALGWADVQISSAKDERETILEFCSCGGGSIGSNSTFSWWLAWFAAAAAAGAGDEANYEAFFPTPWVRGLEAPAIFTLPFTHAVRISDLPQEPRLHSFPFS